MFGFEYAILLTIIVNTLVKYILHSIDVQSENPWEAKAVFMLYAELIIGFIKGVCFAVFLFNGWRILQFESGGSIHALMMLIHAYRSIWCKAKSGWARFVKFRSAVKKINALPDATLEQLSLNDDVCSICCEEMKTGTAKKTECNHYFHRKCLYKWICFETFCPLCHRNLSPDMLIK